MKTDSRNRLEVEWGKKKSVDRRENPLGQNKKIESKSLRVLAFVDLKAIWIKNDDLIEFSRS